MKEFFNKVWQWIKTHVALSATVAGVLVVAIVLAIVLPIALGDKNNGGSTDGDPIYHEWNEWVRESDPTCDQAGKKTRTCKLDPTHTETADIAALGHDYGNTGKCLVCSTSVTLPKNDSSAKYTDIATLKINEHVTGDAFARYNGNEGYYEVEIGCVDFETETWLSFSAATPGQYALYSITNPANVKVARYDASSQYIPTDEDGNYIGFDGIVLEDGNFLSTVSCSKSMWSNQWRATFRLTGNKGDRVKVRFVKIAEPTWTPSYVREEIVPTQIGDVTASDPMATETAVPVPYDNEYFYDETSGYYRLGTKETPGAIIYAAIDAPATRLFGDQSFVSINVEQDPLNLFYNVNADGDYVTHYYRYFIIEKNDKSNANNCYANFVNKDGMYPVTQELFTFLSLYVTRNNPVDVDYDEWKQDPAAYWLAPCYYYAEYEEGTLQKPIVIETETVEITTLEFDFLYYSLPYSADNAINGVTRYVLTWDNENVDIKFNNEFIVSGTEIEVSELANVILEVSSKDGSAVTFTLTASIVALY